MADLLYGAGNLLRAAELDADPDAGAGLSTGAVGHFDLAVHLRRHAWHSGGRLADGPLERP
ncbi:hypothetical protein D3C76_1777850 [compost metagenome]